MNTCSVCGIPVVIADGEIIRACLHKDAPVIASLSAVMYGEADLANGHPEALKLQPTPSPAD